MTGNKNTQFVRKTHDEIRVELLAKASGEMDIGISDKTAAFYQQRVNALLKSTGLTKTQEQLEFLLRTLEDSAANNTYAFSTFRLMKSSVKWWITTKLRDVLNGTKKISDINGFIEYAQRLGDIEDRHLASQSLLTSGQKSKFMSNEIIESVHRSVYKAKRTNTTTLFYLDAYIKANMMVGLRPIEWFDAEIIKDTQSRTLMLKVRNAKHTQGRGFGEFRHIVLNGIRQREIEHILHYLDIISLQKKYGKVSDVTSFAKFNHLLQNSLANHVSVNFPHIKKKPTIYSLRHQVVADAKAAGLSDVEIAAFFGHGSTRTARQHYGTRFNGSGRPFKFKPSAENVEAVLSKQPKSDFFVPTHVQEQAAELFKFVKGNNPDEL